MHVSSNNKWIAKKRPKSVYQFHIAHKNQNKTTLHMMQTNVDKLLILGRFKFNISRLVSEVAFYYNCDWNQIGQLDI
jgi:phosphoribosyl 1,2-cyclic phosphodiesterase